MNRVQLIDASPNPRRGAAGFTLMEAMLAMVVMMVVGLGATSLFFYAIRYNAGAADRAMAIAVAQQQLEELRALSFDDPLLAETPNNGTVASAVCTQAAPCYSSNRPYLVDKFVDDQLPVTINGVPQSTYKLITIRVTPFRGGQPWTNGVVTISTARTTLARGPN